MVLAIVVYCCKSKWLIMIDMVGVPGEENGNLCCGVCTKAAPSLVGFKVLSLIEEISSMFSD
jgi:hypothetical protein